MANNAIINFLFNSKGAEKELSNFKSKFQKTIDTISNSFVGKLGALGTAFAGFAGIKNLYEKTLKIADLVNKWPDLDVKGVSIFSNVLSQFGGSADEAIDALDAIEGAVKDLRLHASGPFKELATTVGISLQKADGSWKSAIEILGDLRQAFRGLNQDAKVDTLEKLGIYSPAMLKLLTSTDAEFARVAQKASSFGVIDERSIKSAERMREAIATLKQSFLSLAMAALPVIVPLVDRISAGFQLLASKSEEVRGAILAVGTAFGFLSPIATVLKVFGSVFSGVVGIIGTSIGVVLKLLSVFKALGLFLTTNPCGLALMGIATIAYLVIENWDTVKGWFVSFYKWLTNLTWDDLINLAETALNTIMDWEKVKKWFKKFSETLGDLAWDGIVKLKDLSGKVVDSWEKVKDWFSGFGKWISNFWDDVMNSCSKGVNLVVEKVKDLLGRIPFIGEYFKDEMDKVNDEAKFMSERDKRSGEMNIDKSRPTGGLLTNNYENDNSRNSTITNNNKSSETVNNFAFNIQTNDAQGFGREIMQYLQQNASGVAV